MHCETFPRAIRWTEIPQVWAWWIFGVRGEWSVRMREAPEGQIEVPAVERWPAAPYLCGRRPTHVWARLRIRLDRLFRECIPKRRLFKTIITTINSVYGSGRLQVALGEQGADDLLEHGNDFIRHKRILRNQGGREDGWPVCRVRYCRRGAEYVAAVNRFPLPARPLTASAQPFATQASSAKAPSGARPSPTQFARGTAPPVCQTVPPPQAGAWLGSSRHRSPRELSS